MSLVNTRTQNLRENSPNLYGWVELPSSYGCYDFMKKDTDAPNSILSRKLKQTAIRSIGSTLQTPVFDKGSVSISSSRSVTISDSELTSQMYDFTFTTYSWGFTQVPTNLDNNEILLQEDFNQKFITYLHKFADTVETACAAKLSTNKTQVFGFNPTNLGYTVVDDMITATYADREKIIGDINPIMRGNRHSGKIHLILNPGLESLIRQMDEKGLYNQENKKIQYSDKELHFSNFISNANGMRGTGYACLGGTTGLLFRMEPESLHDRVMKDGTTWSTDRLPLLDMPVSTYFYEGKGDYSAAQGAASAHNTRAYKQFFGWSVDVCYVTAYNQDLTTYANPIYGFQVGLNA